MNTYKKILKVIVWCVKSIALIFNNKYVYTKASLCFFVVVVADGYLIPAPYYGGINSKTWLYGGMQPVHVPLFSEVKILLKAVIIYSFILKMYLCCFFRNLLEVLYKI